MTTRKTIRILGASLAGTAVEFYDFYIYATAASLVFATLFFPSSSPALGLMAAYASFGVAFVARPVGAIAFGHFGDRVGRKSTLVASLLIMGGSTLAIAFLPTYASIGWLAPVLLCLLRFGQGFGLGGEWSGAALLAVENAPDGWRGRYGMMPQLGAPVGFIAANGLFLLLGLTLLADDFRAWGWRVPFVLSIVLVGVGLWVRLTLVETPAFAAAIAEAPPPKVPLAEVFPAARWRGLGGDVRRGRLFLRVLHFDGVRARLRDDDAGVWARGVPAAPARRDPIHGGRDHRRGLAVRHLEPGARADDRLRADDRCGRVIASDAGGWRCSAGVCLAVVRAGRDGVRLRPGRRVAAEPVPGARGVHGDFGGIQRRRGVIGGGLTPLIAATLAGSGGLWMVGAYLAGAGGVSLVALVGVGRATPRARRAGDKLV